MKYIYLDQNKWIELAKGLKDGNPTYIALYETILKNVENGIWAFPLSFIHITETMKRRNEHSRKELLDLMFLISKGYAICDYMTADAIEFHSWVNSKIVDYSQLKTKIIRHDWVTIVGLSTETANIQFNDCPWLPDEMDKIERIIKEHACDREVFDLICNIINDHIEEDEEFYYRCYESGRQSFLSWKNKIRGLKEYKDKHLYPTYLINVFFKVYKEKIENLPPEMKKTLWNYLRKIAKIRLQRSLI